MTLPENVPDAEVIAWFTHERRAATGSDFAPLHLQKVVAIGCALREGAALRVWSVGEPDDPEPELIRRFFDGLERYTPQLVSWNGGGFDLPVLNHRALIHGVSAAKYWDWGDDDRDFRCNNYLGRYHTSASRSHGRARDVPAPRERGTRRDRTAVRLPRQDRDGRKRSRVGRCGGTHRRGARATASAT